MILSLMENAGVQPNAVSYTGIPLSAHSLRCPYPTAGPGSANERLRHCDPANSSNQRRQGRRRGELRGPGRADVLARGSPPEKRADVHCHDWGLLTRRTGVCCVFSVEIVVNRCGCGRYLRGLVRLCVREEGVGEGVGCPALLHVQASALLSHVCCKWCVREATALACEPALSRLSRLARASSGW